MTTATLCTTNNIEPWGANVPFEVAGNKWTTSLKTKYAHFCNLQSNPNAVIVHNNNGLELIMKVIAELDVNEGDEDARVVFEIEWLRVVADGGVTDYDDRDKIAEEIALLIQ